MKDSEAVRERRHMLNAAGVSVFLECWADQQRQEETLK